MYLEVKNLVKSYNNSEIVINNLKFSVEQGQLIGKTGNTGTRPSTLGTKKESHLHWELILQKNNEEIIKEKIVSRS